MTSKSILAFPTFVANKYVLSTYLSDISSKATWCVDKHTFFKTNIHGHFDVCLIFNKKVYMWRVENWLENSDFCISEKSNFFCPKIRMTKIEFDRNIAFPCFLYLSPFFFISFTSLPVWTEARYIKVKVEHYLLFMFSPPKIS